jgi:hypothetical protein
MTPTTSAFGSRAPRGLAIILLGLLLAACSPGAASVGPSATAGATPEPTAAPTVAVTVAPTPSASTAAAASGSAQPDPAIGLKIDSPYELTALDPNVEAAIGSQISQSAGALGGLFGFGGRTVTKDGKVAGYVFVIGFPAGLLTDATYNVMVSGMQSSMGATFTTQTISGTDVSIGAAATGTIALLHSGDHLVMILTPTAAELPAMAKALIDANK